MHHKNVLMDVSRQSDGQPMNIMFLPPIVSAGIRTFDNIVHYTAQFTTTYNTYPTNPQLILIKYPKEMHDIGQSNKLVLHSFCCCSAQFLSLGFKPICFIWLIITDNNDTTWLVLPPPLKLWLYGGIEMCVLLLLLLLKQPTVQTFVKVTVQQQNLVLH